jgi:glycosyltransferase involved in cell wall biosynthesis
VADNMSTDGTWEAIQRVAADFGHVDAVRARSTGESHALVEGYAGTDTWVFGVDGDELYDPTALAHFRKQLEKGAYREFFSIKSNVLNVTALDREAGTASGYLAPPSRSITKLVNFAAIDAWTECHRQYMHDGEIAFRPGYDRETIGFLGDRFTWEESPLRCLHVCFLRRSSLDAPEAEGRGRLSPIELGGKRRSWFTDLVDRLRPARPRRRGRTRSTAAASSSRRTRPRSSYDAAQRCRVHLRVAGGARRGAVRALGADRRRLRRRRRRRRVGTGHGRRGGAVA